MHARHKGIITQKTLIPLISEVASIDVNMDEVALDCPRRTGKIVVPRVVMGSLSVGNLLDRPVLKKEETRVKAGKKTCFEQYCKVDWVN